MSRVGFEREKAELTLALGASQASSSECVHIEAILLLADVLMTATEELSNITRAVERMAGKE